MMTVLLALKQSLPRPLTILWTGFRGSFWVRHVQRIHRAAFPVQAVTNRRKRARVRWLSCLSCSSPRCLLECCHNALGWLEFWRSIHPWSSLDRECKSAANFRDQSGEGGKVGPPSIQGSCASCGHQIEPHRTARECAFATKDTTRMTKFASAAPRASSARAVKSKAAALRTGKQIVPCISAQSAAAAHSTHFTLWHVSRP